MSMDVDVERVGRLVVEVVNREEHEQTREKTT